MKFSRKIRYRLEYLGVRVGLPLIHAMPAPILCALAGFFADVAYFLLAKRRKIAIENILLGGIANSQSAAARIARASFRHFGILVIEALKAESVIREENWKEFIDYDTVSSDVFDLMNNPDAGVILTTAHFGNWEVAAQVLSYMKPLVAIARRMNNPYTDNLIQTRKTGHRFKMIPKHRATGARLLEVLRNGEILAMLIDQHAPRRGTTLEFLGRPASTHVSAALLHLRSGAPICFGYCVRTGPMRYRMESGPLIIHNATGDRRKDSAMIMKEISERLERAIRAHPEQYFWSHRRWREPTSTDNPEVTAHQELAVNVPD
jgi:KDO2-lipid IV(A) lauroyltransferase